MKILIITGGPVKKLDSFVVASKKFSNIDFTFASFSEVNYATQDVCVAHYGAKKRKKYDLFIGDRKLSEFDLIYFRLVGKRLEDATLVANYAKEHGIRVVDRLYLDSLLMPSSISKAAENAKLIKAGIPIPKTIYGNLKHLSATAPREIGYPVVFKSTTGRKAREVWIAQDEEGLVNLIAQLRPLEKNGARFFAQEFVKAALRYRVFVIGKEVLAVISAPTKWRKRFSNEKPEKGLVLMPSSKMKEIGVAAAQAAGLDISGVDILKMDETGELLVIEANAAPSWKLVEKYTGKNVAEEIIKFLITN